jgi:hypothetical protein
MTSTFGQQWEDSAQQWPEQIRVLLAAIPNFQQKKRRLQMNKFRFTINALAVAAFVLAVASFTQAQATRTWVSGVGDDANPCSRTAPCKTFAGAISKTAVDGEIDALDPGGFGAVTITKAITIDGGPTGEASILAAGVTGILVSITATSGSNTVQLRNLSINGAATGTNGIRIISSFAGTSVFVEDCVIFGFRAGNGRGISDERSGSGNLFVLDTIVKNNSGVGIAVIGNGATKATLDNVRMLTNSNGVIVSQTANNTLTARNCVANSNGAIGFSAQSGAQMDLINCQASLNATGVDSASGALIRMSRNTVSRNTANGLGFSGGTIQSYGNNEVSANTGNNGPFSAGGPVLQ